MRHRVAPLPLRWCAVHVERASHHLALWRKMPPSPVCETNLDSITNLKESRDREIHASQILHEALGSDFLSFRAGGAD